ncbi:NBP2b protein, putative [Perkinsus marinus ATCC 50983]|uniref:NBP2b protein, putative n=1 Tax=Perkinsus marinus (strain ATCC 50983 / TXsc) TaxID=423536 RepID=C5L3U4_PERM5|nr:NBP2b protein, putative [Perkinsus marinus ATCC 50983]EER08673.1 NBP2b protein, putative [Perkinsus marinus ATCC 50983]|eukprot:XP_002776857.1 NBP2b protein, putative [Perkinsus marinus ATCC 50983]
MDEVIAIVARTDADLIEEVTNIKAEADDSENSIRIENENARMDRYEALQIEAVTSNRKNAAVDMKWADFDRIKIARELAKELEMQTKACQAIIDSKDRRIREFLSELEDKNYSYVKAMERAEQDVGKMSKLITANIRKQRDVHRKQLESFERLLERERVDLLDKQKREMDDLFEKRRQREENEFFDQRQEREKGFQQRTDELLHRDLDEFNKAKISLENSINELEEHSERTMATYQLNKEKLDYNLQVLAERNKEHTAIEAAYKMKLGKMRNAKQKISQKFAEMEATLRKENTDLTEDLDRLMQQYRQVLEKTQTFQEQDEKKFSEIWANNEREVKSLVEKVLDGDRIIHEQLLGLDWAVPSVEQMQQEIEVMSEAGTVTGKASTALLSSESGRTASSGGGRFSGSKVKAVMDWIREEAAFLLDINVKEQCKDLPPEHRAVVEIDAILRAIGCDDQRDIDLLVSQFFRGQDEDDETCLVEADDILKLITEFMVEKENLKLAEVAPDKKKKGQKGGEKTDAEKAARRRREERKYLEVRYERYGSCPIRFWERIGHALPSMNVRLHEAVESCLNRQLKLLNLRATAVQACVDIEKENVEVSMQM